MSSPRSWRCFPNLKTRSAPTFVFSTLVEVFLTGKFGDVLDECLLHARGGVSFKKRARFRCRSSSPRSWRCFSFCIIETFIVKVFSTLVEVFLPTPRLGVVTDGLLHARGGVSFYKKGLSKAFLSSPRSWRCFQVSEMRSSEN